MEFPSSYEPKAIEERYYQFCEQQGYFAINGNRHLWNEPKTFSIMLPPPNVTGTLHIGHALNHTLIDIMVRYKRMDGYKTLWQPGTDHAGIATQNVVEKQLLAQGTTKEALGRESFIDRVWQWKDHSGSTIVRQMRKLGVTPDWSRERFTMDEGLARSVRKAFVSLYNDKIIVRDNYMVNWCTHDGALSDIEVEHEEHKGALYHIRYPIEGTNESVVVATTRPETYFGDTAVMVHPDDERYTHLIGKKVVLPLIDRAVTIIADEHVDREFGTGVVKVTPAHDTNDYEVGKRHNLEFLTIFDEQGLLNEACGDFAGRERLAARPAVVEALDQAGFMVKIEEHIHQVGHCYRCHNVVEPYISKQWFIKKEMAQKAIDKVNDGDTKFFPPQWKNNYDAWMRELRDWCISRQLWWGHRIPVWTCQTCGHEWASIEEQEHTCPQCSRSAITQDPDVLDTWFSSALWPFTTLGWGNENNPQTTPEDLKDFYPNSLLITGFDILFFWVARMLTMGTHFLGDVPFKDVYLHALVRDEHGQKMSKSKGNVIDPIDMVNEYSADTLRFTLAILAAQGRDIRLSTDKTIESRNFTNKLFNAARYLSMNVPTFADLDTLTVSTPLGRYMQGRLSTAIHDVRAHLDAYRFNDAAAALYRFLWDEFCDWGIELSKTDKSSLPELGAIYKEGLKLLHPFMPFITDHLIHLLSGTTLENDGSIMVKAYPQATPIDPVTQELYETVIEAIVAIRRAKATVDLANKKIAKAYIKLSKDVDATIASAAIAMLGKVEEIEFVTAKVEGCAVDVSATLEVFIPMSAEDKEAIRTKLTKQKEKVQKEYDKINGMLSNERFRANAPAHVLEENTKALEEITGRLEKIVSELASFEG